ncbi:MFS transporter [Sphingobium phenoxybenzoativorans]|uniref:MFS transporter n=1 Tax=Sphingobium phenoxybenzoativorans TaxID=1592790 RepID=A0A975KCS6_9SPHN|nr:MFS transporter [Sphingobium phenoxybenzoativorans]QUT07807.1 MFS transporter [Sphingobium phenoxybenzoativorans]
MAKLKDWAVVFLLTGAVILSFVDRYAFAVLLDPIKHTMHLSDGQIGLLNGIAFGLFYACMGLPLGWLADKWSRKGTIMACIAAWSAATACCGLARNYTQLLAARIGVGAGEAGLVPSAYAIMHDRFDKASLAKPFSVFTLGGHVGAGASLLITGFLFGFFSRDGGAGFMSGLLAWQKTFVVIALPGIIFVLLVAFIREAPRTAAADTRVEKGFFRLVKAQIGTYTLLYAGMAGMLCCTMGLLSWMPAVFIREFGFTPGEVGASYGAIVLIVAPFGVFAGGFVADALQKRGYEAAHPVVLLSGPVLTFPLICLLPFVGAATPMLVLVGALHFCVAIPQGVAAAYIQIITAQPIRSRMSAVYVMVGNVTGLGLVPVSIGYLSDLYAGTEGGLRMAIFYVLATSLATALVTLGMLFVRQRKPVPAGNSGGAVSA